MRTMSLTKAVVCTIFFILFPPHPRPLSRSCRD
jgi:hypothetical protein